jgi:dCMP deaminase
MINFLGEPMQNQRPSWDEYFILLAKAVSLRADCTRSKVGAVLVDQVHGVIKTGYNGAPPGAPGCLTAGACPRGRLSYDEHPPEGSYANCIANHAERNAILNAHPSLRAGSTLYITRRPCTGCHELILAEGILWIVWETPDGQIARERQFH